MEVADDFLPLIIAQRRVEQPVRSKLQPKCQQGEDAIGGPQAVEAFCRIPPENVVLLRAGTYCLLLSALDQVPHGDFPHDRELHRRSHELLRRRGVCVADELEQSLACPHLRRRVVASLGVSELDEEGAEMPHVRVAAVDGGIPVHVLDGPANDYTGANEAGEEGQCSQAGQHDVEKITHLSFPGERVSGRKTTKTLT